MIHQPTQSGLLRPHKVTLSILESILKGCGYSTEMDDSCILAEDSINPILIGIIKDTKLIDLSGLIELRPGCSLSDTARFVNWLNNADPIVRFALGESVNPDNPIDRIAMPDASALWGNVSLPFGSGLVVNQFVAAIDLLNNGLDHAFTKALEDGFVDAPMCEACAEQFEAEEDSYAH
jgi:hypothetical protein